MGIQLFGKCGSNQDENGQYLGLSRREYLRLSRTDEERKMLRKWWRVFFGASVALVIVACTPLAISLVQYGGNADTSLWQTSVFVSMIASYFMVAVLYFVYVKRIKPLRDGSARMNLSKKQLKREREMVAAQLSRRK